MGNRMPGKLTYSLSVSCLRKALPRNSFECVVCVKEIQERNINAPSYSESNVPFKRKEDAGDSDEFRNEHTFIECNSL